ncbi:MAG: hypothetical protein U5Q44_09220 [Dehalococcoidia bacterium]|nr:hypothetical protein [Dehalococcoidia bacterium]
MALDIAGLALFGNETFHRWLVFGLATPVQVVLGWQFVRGGIASLRHLNPNMDVLVALGTGIAFLYSAFVVISGTDAHMHFDVSVAVLVFISLGRYYENRAKSESNDAAAGVAGHEREECDGVPGRRGARGPGWRAPGRRHLCRSARGEGAGRRRGRAGPKRLRRVDAHRRTGADRARCRRRRRGRYGDQDGAVQVRLTAVGNATVLGRLVEVVEEAQGSKAPVEWLVNRVSAVFVPAVIGVALLTFAGWDP